MRLLSSLLPSLFAVSILTACGSTTPGQERQPLPVSEARSPAERILPNASLELVQELTANNAGFALDLLRQIPEKGNLFYSPHSISLAAAMTYAGASGDTKAQMKDVLHFALSDDGLNAAFNTLDQWLASRGEGAKGADEKPFRLRIANALWAQQGHQFLPSYLDILAKDYGAGVNLLDFAKNAEAARHTINDWVSTRTEERIPELLPEGVLDSNTRFVLTNAVYFNAAWAKPFAAEATQDGPFTLVGGSQVTVPLMHARIEGRYAEDSGYQAAEIPYDSAKSGAVRCCDSGSGNQSDFAFEGKEIAMLAILPKAESLESFEASLDSRQLDRIVGSLSAAKIRLTLPRFEMRSRLALADVLKAMGMPAAFTPEEADFSGMDGARDLFLSHVIHEAFVKVNEAGTEAAAATAIIGEMTSYEPTPEMVFEATRPFLFVIRDIETGATLFVGRVVDPSS